MTFPVINDIDFFDEEIFLKKEKLILSFIYYLFIFLWKKS